MNQEIQFQPVLLGSDINVYGMARSFHQEYGVTSVAIGKGILGPCTASKIVTVEVVEPNLEDDAVFVKTLLDFAKRYEGSGKKLLLVPCGDNYIKLLVRNQEKLRGAYVFECISEELLMRLSIKESFYQVCTEHGFAFPKTTTCSYENYKNVERPQERAVARAHHLHKFHGVARLLELPGGEDALVEGHHGVLVPVDNEEGRQGLALLHVVERVAGLGNLRVVDDAAPKEDILRDFRFVRSELGVPGAVVDAGYVAGAVEIHHSLHCVGKLMVVLGFKLPHVPGDAHHLGGVAPGGIPPDAHLAGVDAIRVGVGPQKPDGRFHILQKGGELGHSGGPVLYAGHHKARLGQGHQLGQAEVHVLLPPGGALDVHHQGIA